MAIVPNGARRKVVAQGLDQNAGFGIGDYSKESSPQIQPQDAQPQEQPIAQNEEPEKEEGSFISVPKNTDGMSDEASDVSQYIFNKLQSFGYPPRRLERFEEEFVHEKLFPGGAREIEIVVPDRYYAKKQRISDKDFALIVKEIQNKFGLTFTEAERKDKKLIMQFSSDNPQESQNEEEVPGDVLDEVYGPGGGPSSSESKPKAKKNPMKKASTMNELLKMSKAQLVQRLINGDLA